MKFDERKKKKKKKSPFFISMATAAKFVLPIPILLAHLIPLDMDVTGNITAKICEAWSVFNIFCTLVTMAMAAILNFFNPQKLTHTTVDIPTKFMKFDERNPQLFLIPPFLFPWQLRQSLSNQFRFFWLISFH
jgi:hypothetical protein